MQIITTGLSMEIIFDILFLCLLSYLIGSNICMSKKIKSIDIDNEFFKRKFIVTLDSVCANIDEIELKTVKMSGQLDRIQDEMHRSLLALRDSLETAKPIKPNNWDSVKEAFKGPVRIDINERN
jgi:hypothetical protein